MSSTMMLALIRVNVTSDCFYLCSGQTVIAAPFIQCTGNQYTAEQWNVALVRLCVQQPGVNNHPVCIQIIVPSTSWHMSIIILACIRIRCEVSQNMRPLQYFHNTHPAITFHSLLMKISYVISGFLLSTSRWGAFGHKFSRSLGCTMFR